MNLVGQSPAPLLPFRGGRGCVLAQEIGVAYVSLLPSGRGFSKATQDEAEKAFKGAEKSSSGFFSGVAKWAKRGTLLVGGMVAGVGALAAKGGISRALNIEDATAKLQGLGHDTKAVEQIMSDALASVKGTAFGLDTAATMAASAVAAGIKPGRELERYLRLTADAATIAGGSMDDLGRVMNNVTTLGAAYNDSLQILAQKGLPIYDWLAEKLGVTTAEVKELASQGKVSAEVFRGAIEDNIAGAALTAGDTTRGAFENMRAALSRLGVAFVGDGLSGAKTFFTEVTVILDGLTERVGPWADLIQEKLRGAFEIEGMGERFLAWLDDFGKSFDSSPFGLMFEALKPLIPVAREFATDVGPVLADTLGQILEAVAPLIPLLGEELVNALVILAPPVTDLLVALLPLIPPLVQLAVQIIPLLTPLITGLAHVVGWMTESFTEWLGAVQAFAEFTYGDGSLQELKSRLEDIPGPMGAVLRGFVSFMQGATTAIVTVRNVWVGMWSNIQAVFASAESFLKSRVQALWNLLPEEFRIGVARAVMWVRMLPVQVMAALGNAGQWLVNSGKALIAGFIRGIQSKIREVASAVAQVMSVAKGFFPHSPAKWGPFSGAGWTQLTESGGTIVDEFLSGLQAGGPTIQAALNHVVSVPSMAGVASAVTSGLGVGDSLRLVVDGREFTAFVDDRANTQVHRASSSRRVAFENGYRG